MERELEVMVIEKLKRAGLTIDLMSDIVSDGDNRRAIDMVNVVEKAGFRKMLEFNVNPLSESIDFSKMMKIDKNALLLNWDIIKVMLEFFHEPRRAVIYSISEISSIKNLKEFIENKGGVSGDLLGLMLLSQQFGKRLPKNLWLLSLASGQDRHSYRGIPASFYLVKNNNGEINYFPIDESSPVGNRFSMLFFY